MPGENRDTQDPQITVLEESKSEKYYGDKLYAFRGHPDCTMATYTHARTQKCLQYNVVDLFSDSDKLHYRLRSTHETVGATEATVLSMGKSVVKASKSKFCRGFSQIFSSDCHASDLSSLPPFSLQVSRGRIKRARPASAHAFHGKI